LSEGFNILPERIFFNCSEEKLDEAISEVLLKGSYYSDEIRNTLNKLNDYKC
jgi:hypothetical protein